MPALVYWNIPSLKGAGRRQACHHLHNDSDDEQEGGRGGGDNDDDEANTNAIGTSTSTANAGQDDDRDKEDTTMPTAPDPSATSNCSQGGYGMPRRRRDGVLTRGAMQREEPPRHGKEGHDRAPPAFPRVAVYFRFSSFVVIFVIEGIYIY
jgi:hypothetical protein